MKIKLVAAIALTGIFTASYSYAKPIFVPVDDMTTPPGTMAAATSTDASVTTNTDMSNTGTNVAPNATTDTSTSTSTTTTTTTPSDDMSADTATGDDDY